MADQKPLILASGSVRQIPAGDVLVTPGVKVDAASGNATAQLNSAVGSGSHVIGSRAGNTVWQLALGNATAQPGANVGADFSLGRYSDTGVFLATALSINRSTGAAVFNSSVQSGTGWVGRAGIAGATSNLFNLNWTGSAMQLWVDSTNIGSISVTSDERVKKYVTALAGNTALFMRIKPVRYRFRKIGIFSDDGIWCEGWSAQNFTEIGLDAAVAGNVNAVSENGDPIPASVLDRPILARTVLEVQRLVVANDELRTLVAILTARLDALSPSASEIPK